jgi:hypothetical protein
VQEAQYHRRMTVLDRLRTRFERRRGVLAAEEAEAPVVPAALIPTAGTPRLERPRPTPSMQIPGIGGTAGTQGHRAPHGTPSTERLHNPRHGF